MTIFDVSTRKYDIDLKSLLSRRLSQCGCVCGITGEGGAVSVTLREESQRQFAEAMLWLMCRDLMYLEMAEYVDALPLELSDKQSILRKALKAAEPEALPQEAMDRLYAYLQEASSLNLEGYLAFRMGERLTFWQRTVDQAASETCMQREYAEVLSALHTYVQTSRPRIGELSVCLHPDGSCTLTDDSDARIEYMDSSDDGLISLLIGMAPRFLTVYDLTGDCGKGTAETIRRVFAGRVKIYR